MSGRSAVQSVSVLLIGLVFGVGLTLSGMLDPERILNFLDVLGQWDPTLLLVMIAAVLVSAAGYLIKPHLRAPLFDSRFHVPPAGRPDVKLIVGAMLFGIGWGLVGFCPAPAILDAGQGYPAAIGFVLAMLGGMLLARRFK